MTHLLYSVPPEAQFDDPPERTPAAHTRALAAARLLLDPGDAAASPDTVLERLLGAACELADADGGAVIVREPAADGAAASAAPVQVITCGLSVAAAYELAGCEPDPAHLVVTLTRPESNAASAPTPGATAGASTAVAWFAQLHLSRRVAFDFEAIDGIDALVSLARNVLRDADRRVATRRRLDWLEAITSLSRHLREAGDSLLLDVVSRARSAARADYASIVLPARDGHELTVAAAAGPGADIYRGLTFTAQDSVLGRAIVAGERLIVTDVIRASTSVVNPPNPCRFGPAMVLPLRDGPHALGALMVCRTQAHAPFEVGEADLAGDFVDHVAALLARDCGTDGEVAASRAPGPQHRRLATLHDTLAQRVFATGLGLQSLAERAEQRGDADGQARLRAHIVDLDETLAVLRAESERCGLIAKTRRYPQLTATRHA